MVLATQLASTQYNILGHKQRHREAHTDRQTDTVRETLAWISSRLQHLDNSVHH